MSPPSGVVHYIKSSDAFRDTSMTMPEEFTVPEAAAYLKVSEETVRRNIRSKRLSALRRGTQWFIPHDVLMDFGYCYDPKTGKVEKTPHMARLDPETSRSTVADHAG